MTCGWNPQTAMDGDVLRAFDGVVGDGYLDGSFEVPDGRGEAFGEDERPGGSVACCAMSGGRCWPRAVAYAGPRRRTGERPVLGSFRSPFGERLV